MSLYIVKRPFTGCIQTGITKHEDGTLTADLSATFGSGKPDSSVADYLAKKGNDYYVVTDSQLDALMAKHEQELISKVETITAEYFNSMLEILPPCRWSSYGMFEGFHVSERYTGNLVHWYGRCGDKHFSFLDQADATRDHIAAKFNKAIIFNRSK